MTLPTMRSRNGGKILIEALVSHGVEMAFCVPGESFLPALDALHDVRDSIRLIVCRHEAAAAHMAEAYGKLTGKPGVCLVTRGPGATQASIGVHTASQDSTPMILLVGQVNSTFMGRDAWQEIDITRMFAPMAKWATQVNQIERLPEVMQQAFQVAMSGRPGPVVIAVPEDVLYALSACPALDPLPLQPAVVSATELASLQRMLDASKRPLVILGGSGWTALANEQVRAFVEHFDLPVCTSFRRQDLWDNRDPRYAGSLGIGVSEKLAQRVRDADLILAIGTRLGETTTSEYQLLQVPRPRQTLVHVHSDVNELGRVYQAALPIHSGVPELAQALSQLKAPAISAWQAWTLSAQADYLETLTPTPMPGPINLAEVMTWLQTRLPPDAIVSNGAGNYTSWVHRFHQYRALHTELAPISGTMGYGVPAAITAKLLHPDRTVICFAGDGCFQMSAQELATVKQYQLSIIFIVINNSMYGSIRMHQEMNFPGKVYGTSLENPDFPALAKAYGLHGQLVERTADFPAAFERAVQAGTGALIELRTDSEGITPRTTLSALRQRALNQRADS